MTFIPHSASAPLKAQMNVTGMDELAAMVRIFMLALFMLCGQGISAQDAMPETPPELKDFRLDPQNAKPAEPPQTKTLVIEVPDVPVAEPTPKPSTPKAQSPQKPKPAIPIPNPQSSQSAPLPAPATDVPQAGSTDPLPTTVETRPAPDPELATSTEEGGFDPAKLNWWLIAAGLGLAAIVLLGLGAWTRRRKHQAGGAYEEDAPPFAPEVLADTDTTGAHVIVQEPAEASKPMPLLASATVPTIIPEITPVITKAAPANAKRPQLDISFVPKKAVVSIANLTISGEIRIINQGKAAAKSMRLRSIIISASEIQDDVIAAFHNDKEPLFSEELGEAGAGERIGMEIELSIPLTELRSYPLGDRRLFVPIVLANIDYDWGKSGHDVAKLAALIGREATPPTPKMGALRLDLGPRSFTPLGQRPVFG
jgi:hypothetical protein